MIDDAKETKFGERARTALKPETNVAGTRGWNLANA
jgi:hypothetical protein